jgi:hypothetical protein
MSAMERLRRAEAALRERASDPWKRALERHLPANVTSISSVALLDLLDVPSTTGNARRLAKTMRSMGWIGLKSRRLEPGGFRDTTIRGWARPVRKPGHRTSLRQGEKVGSLHLNTPIHRGAA